MGISVGAGVDGGLDADVAGGASEAASEALSTLNAGYLWMLLNCFCQAAYILGMRKRIKLTNFKDFDSEWPGLIFEKMCIISIHLYTHIYILPERPTNTHPSTAMFYNNLLSIPILLFCSLTLESWTAENVGRNFPPEQRNALLLAMVFSGLSSVFISYTSAWCVRVTSSTTYSMVGALNKLPMALSGLIFFDAPVTFGSVSAIAVGFVSGLVYAVAKIRQGGGSRSSSVNGGGGGKGGGSVLPMTSASSQSMRDGLKS